MRHISPAVFLLVGMYSGLTVAQGVEPEACILKALKGTDQIQSAMVRYNCVRQYIRAVEPRAVSVPVDQFSKSIIEWYPTVPAFPNPIQEHLLVHLKNESKLRIISADIILTDEKGGNGETYKAYAEYPIEPGTVGSLSTEVITNTSEQGAKIFWKKHAWNFGAVYGVAR